ncbi:MAG TPA: SpoIIE family protein phosphatase [Bacillus bacterium]|nr:SpoIIE family protein phosphatase [Bacillus sp. (in: firmicutes)]
MNIYIVDCDANSAKQLTTILKKEYKSTYHVTINSLTSESRLSQIRQDSIFVYKGHYNAPIMEQIKNFCLKQQFPLLAVVSKESYSSGHHSFDSGILMDVVTDPTESELFLRIRLLLKHQDEMRNRIDKEIQLKSAINHITNELELAKKLQQLVLPKDFSNQDIKFNAIYKPSEQLSGDLYFWVKISPHEYGFILMDVSGHGVHASLVSMAMRSLLPGLLKRVKNPEKISKALNEHMLALFEGRNDQFHYVTTYFTAMILLIDTQKKSFSYVNAGHQPGLMLQDGIVRMLESTMVPIGLIHAPRIEAKTIHYQAPAKLLLYTDGLIETPNCTTISRLQRLITDFTAMENEDESFMLEEFLTSRIRECTVSDDICIVSITLN